MLPWMKKLPNSTAYANGQLPEELVFELRVMQQRRKSLSVPNLSSGEAFGFRNIGLQAVSGGDSK